ncbi:MAG: DUF4040 domain-containing protein [Clostridiales bacterium]|jgi:multicomponent Na+:H+ antiporter subunit B|nr:DUF4040 domain-containing protein [Clostridiales bacterium]
MQIMEVILIIWIIAALVIIFESRVYRNIIYFGIFSLITSVCFLMLGSPDVAMAEAAIAVFATIFFIICIERYYGRKGHRAEIAPVSPRNGRWFTKIVLPLAFCAGLFALFVNFMPTGDASTYLKELYLTYFSVDVGGENAVAAILLGYRVYDTLFEALILVVAVVAVAHMSWLDRMAVDDGRHSEIENSSMAVFTMRIISPIILLFGTYLILNGHISAGGGFQGGVAIATFFICRYMIYDIYDISVKKVIKLEEYVFVFIVVIAVFAVFVGSKAFLAYTFDYFTDAFHDAYLIIMNVLIGLKVACGFFIIFYRYVAIERREDSPVEISQRHQDLGGDSNI